MMNFLKYVGLKKGVKKSTDEQMGAYIEPSSGLFSVIQQAKLRSDPEIFPYNMNRIIPQRINLAQIDVDVLKSQKSLFDDVVKESEKILSGDDEFFEISGKFSFLLGMRVFMQGNQTIF
jgi:hypothetical protein